MTKRLFVGNLPYTANEEDLASVFETNGFVVQQVHIVYDRETDRSKGFGFVELDSTDNAQKAMQTLNGFLLRGRPIAVKEAIRKDRPERRDRV